MNITFSNAPLIEIIAELRWAHNLASTTQVQPGVPVIVLNSPTIDEFFMRFGGEIYSSGFKKTERLVPPDFPTMLYQPVFRYRRDGEDGDGAVLYQAGPGIFSANAIPPYKSWDVFSPAVKSGVEALLIARDETEKDSPFNTVSLRYIDAFGPNLTQGMDVRTFLSDVLGVSVALPEGISKVIAPNAKVKPHIQLLLPINDNTNMNLTLTEAIVNNELSIIMDSTVVITGEIAPNAEAVMNSLNDSHDIIHEMFINLTGKIRELMSPVERA